MEETEQPLAVGTVTGWASGTSVELEGQPLSVRVGAIARCLWCSCPVAWVAINGQGTVLAVVQLSQTWLFL